MSAIKSFYCGNSTLNSFSSKFSLLHWQNGTINCLEIEPSICLFIYYHNKHKNQTFELFFLFLAFLLPANYRANKGGQIKNEHDSCLNLTLNAMFWNSGLCLTSKSKIARVCFKTLNKKKAYLFRNLLKEEEA